jgi:hypothetical protein
MPDAKDSLDGGAEVHRVVTRASRSVVGNSPGRGGNREMPVTVTKKAAPKAPGLYQGSGGPRLVVMTGKAQPPLEFYSNTNGTSPLRRKR